jgi:hypothetical protein
MAPVLVLCAGVVLTGTLGIALALLDVVRLGRSISRDDEQRAVTDA